MAAQDPVVVVEDLAVRYGLREVLTGVTLSVAPGEVHVVVGGSGCGKSTLLKAIVGLVQPTRGEVSLLGVCQRTADEPEWQQVLRRTGVLFQGGALINSLSLADNVALPIRECAPELPEAVVAEMVAMKLAMVGLSHAVHLNPPQLSGGMKKRAALARAMALDPTVLFCDEPSAGLDPVTAADLDRLLLDLRDRFGMAVVVVTHELASIEQIADRITMLVAGKVIVSGAKRQVMEAKVAEVRAFFDRENTPRDRGDPSVLAALCGKERA